MFWPFPKQQRLRKNTHEGFAMFMDYLEPVCRNACLLFATAVVKVLSLSLPSSPSVSPSHRHTLTPLVPKAASRCAKCSSATSHSCLSRAAPEVTTNSPPISTPFFQRHHLKMMTTSHLRPSSANPEPFPPLLRPSFEDDDNLTSPTLVG